MSGREQRWCSTAEIDGIDRVIGGGTRTARQLVAKTGDVGIHRLTALAGKRAEVAIQALAAAKRDVNIQAERLIFLHRRA